MREDAARSDTAENRYVPLPADIEPGKAAGLWPYPARVDGGLAESERAEAAGLWPYPARVDGGLAESERAEAAGSWPYPARVDGGLAESEPAEAAGSWSHPATVDGGPADGERAEVAGSWPYRARATHGLAGSLAGLLAGAEALLLDFDGPVCRLFAGRPAPAVAERLRATIAAHGMHVPAPPAGDDGPLQVLRRVADAGDPRLTRLIADRVRDAEVGAVATADPTPGAVDMLRTAYAAGLPVAIVSNNSVEAVRAYLREHRLGEYVAHVVGRYDGMDPRLLKPETHLITLALAGLGRRASRTPLVGDSISDIRAARAAGVPVIGYANKPGKYQAMTDARADVIITGMAELDRALRTTPPRSSPAPAPLGHDTGVEGPG